MTDWFVFRPERAQAFGRPTDGGFLARSGSTAIVSGTSNVKRDRPLRDKLVRDGVLVGDSDLDQYRFTRDFEFTSASAAAGVVNDGNSSGPSQWLHQETMLSLQKMLHAKT